MTIKNKLKRQLIRKVRIQLRSYKFNDESNCDIIYLPFTDYYAIIKKYDSYIQKTNYC